MKWNTKILKLLFPVFLVFPSFHVFSAEALAENTPQANSPQADSPQEDSQAADTQADSQAADTQKETPEDSQAADTQEETPEDSQADTPPESPSSTSQTLLNQDPATEDPSKIIPLPTNLSFSSDPHFYCLALERNFKFLPETTMAFKSYAISFLNHVSQCNPSPQEKFHYYERLLSQWSRFQGNSKMDMLQMIIESILAGIHSPDEEDLESQEISSFEDILQIARQKDMFITPAVWNEPIQTNFPITQNFTINELPLPLHTFQKQAIISAPLFACKQTDDVQHILLPLLHRLSSDFNQYLWTQNIFHPNIFAHITNNPPTENTFNPLMLHTPSIENFSPQQLRSILSEHDIAQQQETPRLPEVHPSSSHILTQKWLSVKEMAAEKIKSYCGPFLPYAHLHQRVFFYQFDKDNKAMALRQQILEYYAEHVKSQLPETHYYEQTISKNFEWMKIHILFSI